MFLKSLMIIFETHIWTWFYGESSKVKLLQSSKWSSGAILKYNNNIKVTNLTAERHEHDEGGRLYNYTKRALTWLKTLNHTTEGMEEIVYGTGLTAMFWSYRSLSGLVSSKKTVDFKGLNAVTHQQQVSCFSLSLFSFSLYYSICFLYKSSSIFSPQNCRVNCLSDLCSPTIIGAWPLVPDRSPILPCSTDRVKITPRDGHLWRAGLWASDPSLLPL